MRSVGKSLSPVVPVRNGVCQGWGLAVAWDFWSETPVFYQFAFFFQTSELRVSETPLRVNTGRRDDVCAKDSGVVTLLAGPVSKRFVLFSET